jgi:hypothetical protein
MGDADLDDIDWTREPRSNAERALRVAIIAHIESESMAPFFTAMRLRRLSGDTLFGRNAASDLHEAIERWVTRARDERFAHDRAERKRLLSQGRAGFDERNR